MKTSWQTKKLGEVCDIQNGYAFKSSTYVDSGARVIRISNVQNGYISDKNPKFIALKSKKDFIDFEINQDDILVSLTGDVGRVGVFPKELLPAFLNQRVGRFLNINEDFISKDYLFYFLDSEIFESEVISGATGAAQKNTSTRKIKEIYISFPSLAEQKRIVKTLDEVFGEVKRAKEIAEKNLQNSKEFFESYLQSVFVNPGKDWVEKKLVDLSKKKDAIVSGPFGSNLKVSDYIDNGVPILRLQNLGKGHFINKNIKYISKEKAEELKYHSFVPGDIALAKLGIPIGKTSIIPTDFKPGIITADVVRIRPDIKMVDYKFLEHFLNTNLSISQLTSNISGATRPRVNLSDVRNIEINLPPLSKQKNIAKKLNSLSVETRKLEKMYEQKLNSLEELKKSVLRKAFNAEL